MVCSSAKLDNNSECTVDEEMREFFARSNPWALHGIAERFLEAADRKLGDAPDPATLAALRRVYLETEGELEDR